MDRLQLLQTVAANVRFHRKRKEWSQQELATRAGVTRVTITRIEGAKFLPDTQLLFELADQFRVSTDRLRRPQQSA